MDARRDWWSSRLERNEWLSCHVPCCPGNTCRKAVTYFVNEVLSFQMLNILNDSKCETAKQGSHLTQLDSAWPRHHKIRPSAFCSSWPTSLVERSSTWALACRTNMDDSNAESLMKTQWWVIRSCHSSSFNLHSSSILGKFIRPFSRLSGLDFTSFQALFGSFWNPLDSTCFTATAAVSDQSALRKAFPRGLCPA